MKRPYLDYWQRFNARQDTLEGARLRAHLAVMKFKRSIDEMVEEFKLKIKEL